jgi:3-hydroxyacyl-CoA dehydrogenase/enoyl-CoA hydratase/3-hydroxybutyryl-CoA epimerase
MNLVNLTFETKNEIAYVGFGKFETKSMTTLTKETLEELVWVVKELSEMDKKKLIKAAIFFSHKKGVFLAGVDVTVINGLQTEADAIRGVEAGQNVYNNIQDLKIPTAALVDGICLGGGLELSLACKKIFVSDSSKTALGLPEVMLGVLPGFGGTYRLPRKVGLTTALDMILTGKQIKSKPALKMGLADAILPAERMLELAPSYLFMNTKKAKSFKENFVASASETFIARKIIFQKAKEKVLESTKGFYPAPLKILEVLESAYGKNRTQYLSIEAQAFATLCQTKESKNLQHVFFLTDESKKLANKDSIPAVEKSAVLGAGVMGGGIAWLLANNNQAPIMKDLTQVALELGLKQASNNFSSALKRKKMTQDDFERKMRSIETVTSFAGFLSVDLVIEAVVENMDIKKKVLAELESEVRDDTLITTNSSSLSITEMSRALKNSKRFAGLHFFNPVHKMPLVEIIKHPGVDSQVIDQLYKWTLDVKKTPIVVNDGPGFLVNRILAPFLNEAAYLLSEGVSLQDLDQAALNFGMPMGPCRLMDEIGLDVCTKVGHIMQDGLGARAHAHDLSQKLYEAKLFGKKNGQGFYLYDEKGKSKGPNMMAEALLPAKKIKMDEATIIARLIYPMVNEASYCLQDKIAEKAATVDIGVIYGLGFAPFRGGVLKFADDVGLENILADLDRFSSEFNPERFKASPFLRDMVKNNKKFYDL